MNSLEMYTSYLMENKFKRRAPEQKIFWADEVIKAVVAELNAPPFDLGNSAFVMETARIIDELKDAANKFIPVHWQGKAVTLADAVIVLSGVRKSFANDRYSLRADMESVPYEQFLSQTQFFFNDKPPSNEKELISGIEQDLNVVQSVLKEIQSQYQAQAAVAPQSVQVEVQPPPADEMQSLERPPVAAPPTAQPAPIKAASPILRQTKPTATPVQIPAKSPTKSVMDDFTARTNAQIELQKHIAAVERERTKRSELRREKISAWRDEQTELAQSLKALQLPAQKILEDLRSFSDSLAENYIMQFAAAQIELFNLIADNFDSHAPKAEQSQNRDYRDAVDNCKDYLDMIIDALADFGVDEISSADGTPFDGKIHDVKNTKTFSPRSATVKKSLRPGFRYGERVLQKEAVEV